MSVTDSSSRIGIGAAAQFGGTALQQILKYAANIIIAHGAGAAVLGLYQLALTAWIAVQRTFCGGLMRAIMRFVPHHMARDEEDAASAAATAGLTASWAIGFVLGGALYFAADLVATDILNTPAAAPVLRVLGLAMPFAAIHNAVWALGRSLNSIYYVFIQFVMVPLSFLLFVGGAVIYFKDPQASIIAWALAASYALALIPLAIYYRSLRQTFPETKPSYNTRPFFNFMGLTAVLSLTEFFSRNIDIFLLGRLGCAADVGHYTMASRTATLCVMVIVSFNAFFSPTVSGLYAARRLERMRRLFTKACGWILLVGAPLVVFLISNAPDILLLFGEDFLVAVPALHILAGAQLINLSTGLVGVVLLMSGKEALIVILNILALGVNAALCQLLIPVYGLTGAAIGLASGFVFLNVVAITYGHIHFGLNPFSATFAKAAVGAAAAGVCNAFIFQPFVAEGPIGLCLGIIGIGTVYIAAVLIMGGRQELEELIRTFKNAAKSKSKNEPQK